MPDFQWADLTAIISAQTLIATIFVGVLLGAFLWSTMARVQTWSAVRVYVAGLAFLLAMAASRWAALSPHWESWLGTIVLWTVYVASAMGSVHAWRWYKRLRYPPRVRENGI